ncbi:hypothetical protein GLN3_00025 [Geobacillus lituanicus]|nr:hypothetical protein GLN3_00025 [Geobacillus lituanicus]
MRPLPDSAMSCGLASRPQTGFRSGLRYWRGRGGTESSFSPYRRICSPTVHCWMQNDWAYVLPYSLRNVLF